MCRYGFKIYKNHYACFKCRKTFKKPPLEDLLAQNGDQEDFKKAFPYQENNNSIKFKAENLEKISYLTKKYIDRREFCPDCGKEMIDLGKDFKAPKKNHKKEWEIIEGLYRIGFAFHTCGCNGPGLIPREKSEYLSYLNERKRNFLSQLSCGRENYSGEDLNEFLNYYNSLVEKIDLELRKFSKKKYGC